MLLQNMAALLWDGFFGLKLHIVTNDKGELLAFKVTRAAVVIAKKLHRYSNR